jgi:hypothetical protein
MFDYTWQFNTIAQYGSYHVNTDEKKAKLFCNGLTIQLQDRLVQSPNLSYNDLASAAIDQERTMKACAEAKEKKRKRTMPRSSENGGLVVLLRSTVWCIPHHQDSCVILKSSIGATARSSSSSSNSSRTVFLPHSRCHTHFLYQNHVLIVCMTQDQLFHTYGQKCSQITKYHE